MQGNHPSSYGKELGLNPGDVFFMDLFLPMNTPAYFPAIATIPFEGPESDNPLSFRHYNPDETIEGKTLKEHLRFSIAYWHSFRGTGGDPFGSGTINRPWETGEDPVSVALRRLEAGFEFFAKIQSPFWCFHDRDIAPEGSGLAESNRNLDRVVLHAKELQQETGVRLLWGTANLFSNPRYMCGAATNPDAHVFAYAAAQVKKALEVTKELGGENYVFWGGGKATRPFSTRISNANRTIWLASSTWRSTMPGR